MRSASANRLLGSAPSRADTALVTAAALTRDDTAFVQERIGRHVALTGSARARAVLASFDPAHFLKVVPRDGPNVAVPIPDVMKVAAPAAA